MGRKHKNAAAREAGGKGAGAGRDDQQQQEAQSDQFVDPPKASIASHPDVGVAIACGLELRVYDARSAHAHGDTRQCRLCCKRSTAHHQHMHLSCCFITPLSRPNNFCSACAGPSSTGPWSPNLRSPSRSKRVPGQRRRTFVVWCLTPPAATCWRAARTRLQGCACGTAAPGSSYRPCEGTAPTSSNRLQCCLPLVEC